VLGTLRAQRPHARAVLLALTGVNFVDAEGAGLLGRFARDAREAGTRVYLCNVKPGVLEVLRRAGEIDTIGRDAIFDTDAHALARLYPTLDTATCSRCSARVFGACQERLPDGQLREPPRPELALEPPRR
jgi:anti-anti-sigma regulatory factor